MPTYLCHGFRWHRKNIRIFTVLHDIEDAAPEWIVGRVTQRVMLSTMRELYDFLPPPPPPPPPQTAAPERPASSRRRKPDRAAYASLALLEEYDPDDLGTLSGPYGYVADHVVRVDLSAGVAGEVAAYEARMREAGSMSGGASDESGRKKGGKGWFERLRGELEAEEEIRWYVVVCGDEERRPGDEEESEAEDDDASRGEAEDEASDPPDEDDPGAAATLAPPPPPPPPGEKRRGLRRFLSDLSLGGKASAGK